jgi:hypothetical protein
MSLIPSLRFMPMAGLAVTLLTASAACTQPMPITPGQSSAPIAGDQPVPTLAPVLREVTPAVVNIAIRSQVVINNPLLSDPFFRRFFGIPEGPVQRETQATGSGVIVDARNGYVLTNNHVVENADRIEVTTKDERRFGARLVGRDPLTDIAVVKIDGDNLTAVPLGDSDRLAVGDYVLAIGNPFGLGQTVTSGIVKTPISQHDDGNARGSGSSRPAKSSASSRSTTPSPTSSTFPTTASPPPSIVPPVPRPSRLGPRLPAPGWPHDHTPDPRPRHHTASPRSNAQQVDGAFRVVRAFGAAEIFRRTTPEPRGRRRSARSVPRCRRSPSACSRSRRRRSG